MKGFPWKFVLLFVGGLTLLAVLWASMIETLIQLISNDQPSYDDALLTGLLFGLFLSSGVVAKQYEFIKVNEGEVTENNIYPKREFRVEYQEGIKDAQEYLKQHCIQELGWKLKKEKGRELLFKAKSKRGPSSLIRLKFLNQQEVTKVRGVIRHRYIWWPVDYGHTHECLDQLKRTIGKKQFTYAG